MNFLEKFTMSTVSLGFVRVAEMLDLQLVQPLFTRSQIGAQARTDRYEAAEIRTWTPPYMPDDTLRGHFEFGLKYERLHFEFLSRVFQCEDTQWLLDWINASPTSAYARRVGFLYEWFTDQRLDVADRQPNVGYELALDQSQYLTCTEPTNNKRWKVRDNMPGTRSFCPLVYLGSNDEQGVLYDVRAGVEQLDRMYGSDLLLRSAAWLTFKESRASFAIEHEQDKNDRVRRFAAAIGELSGHMEDPLGEQGLQELQVAILGSNALRLGVRQSPVFVGQTSVYAQVVHYIAPHPGVVAEMLQGLRDMAQRTLKQNSVARTAALSFAFVYLHPLADGNGRIHRFLMNHLLAADGVVPANIIIPVSATIAGSAAGRAAYDRVLESFSRPLMRRYEGDYNFGNPTAYPDGVTSDLNFHSYQDALHAWRYLDLTSHVRYFSNLLRTTVEDEMAREAAALRDNDSGREAIKGIIEMPDTDADRIIASLRTNNWTVSGKLRREYPDLFSAGGRLEQLGFKLVVAVKDSLQGEAG